MIFFFVFKRYLWLVNVNGFVNNYNKYIWKYGIRCGCGEVEMSLDVKKKRIILFICSMRFL